jgi:hypothetical protein
MVVVVVFRVPDVDSGLTQGRQGADVEAFVANPGVEGLDVAVAPGLAGWDEVQAGMVSRPFCHCSTG